MFLDKVLGLITEKGISKNRFLMDIQISKNSIDNWEKRRNIPPGDIVAKIAQYFNVSADYLLGLTDDTAPSKRTSDTLSGSEQEMLSAYRQLDDSDQGEVRGYINGMLTKEKYKIHNEEAIG